MNERTSSYSLSNGHCAEVGEETRRTSSYSIPNGECAEVGSETRRKSSYSNWSNTCTEVGQQEHVITVGDTKNPNGPRLAVRPVDWSKFLTRVKRDW